MLCNDLLGHDSAKFSTPRFEHPLELSGRTRSTQCLAAGPLANRNSNFLLDRSDLLSTRPTTNFLFSSSVNGKGRPLVDDLEVLLSSSGAPWHDIVLESQRLQPSEIYKVVPNSTRLSFI